MNTTEIKKRIKINSFDELYDYARKQFLTYEKLEGVIPEATEEAWAKYDFSIDCSEDQRLFKDMLQIRFIEELAEASVEVENLDHYLEELSDATNFFLSACVMLGVDFNRLKSPETWLYKEDWLKQCEVPEPVILGEYIRDKMFWKVAEDVGMLCNLLKNRQWSQSNYLVSLEDFHERFLILWEDFWKILGEAGITKKKLFDMFERKYSVNFFRIETGY